MTLTFFGAVVMNVICILCDSLNRHFLAPFGKKIAHTPNLDWLAERSHVFTRHFSGSLPTMPTRREVWTGYHDFLWRPWGALEPWDKDFSGILREQDVMTMLINDSYHLYEVGSGNYHFNFEGWDFIRGHEFDPWITAPAKMPEHDGQLGERYARNMTTMVSEEEYCAPKTMRSVENWLEKNHTHERFFLMVDEFCPHEPFHCPEYYLKRYPTRYKGPLLFWTKYGEKTHDQVETEQLRAQYAATAEMLDKHLGRVFAKMTDLGLWENTALILMTDHGHYLGEHGLYGKPPYPDYNTLSHIPLFVYVPGAEGGKKVNSVTGNVDVFATIMDLFEVEKDSRLHSQSLLPVIQGESNAVRDWTLYGYYGRWISVTDGKRTYIRAPRDLKSELNVYSMCWQFSHFKNPCEFIDESLEIGRFIPHVDMVVGRQPFDPARLFKEEDLGKDYLFDMENDPVQENNLAGTDAEKDCEELLRCALKSVNAPPEQIKRMGLE